MAASTNPVDLELKKAFQELQGKVVFTQKQLKVNDAQIESLRRQNQHSSIVKTEVASLSDTTPTYQSVGRMFILTPKTEVLKSLSKKVKTNEEKIASIELAELMYDRILAVEYLSYDISKFRKTGISSIFSLTDGQNQKTYLQNSMKEAENNLREMISSKQKR